MQRAKESKNCKATCHQLTLVIFQGAVGKKPEDVQCRRVLRACDLHQQTNETTNSTFALDRAAHHPINLGKK